MSKSIAGVILWSWAISVAQVQPTTQPITADQSTPRAAVKSFIEAMTGGNADQMRSLLLASNPLQQRLIDSLIAQQQAIATFQSAANSALGPAATRRLLGNVQRDRNQAIAALPRLPEKITGDTATVGEDEQQETLVRRNGKWMLTMESMLPISCGASGVDPQEIEESIRGMNIRAKVFSETADELRQGKYRTVAQVQRAMENKQAPAERAVSSPVIKSPPTTQNGLEQAVEALKRTLPSKTPEQLISMFIPLGSQQFGQYDYYYDYMTNIAIREELASRGPAARDALQRHVNDHTRILEAVNGPGQTVGDICRQLGGSGQAAGRIRDP